MQPKKDEHQLDWVELEADKREPTVLEAFDQALGITEAEVQAWRELDRALEDAVNKKLSD